MCLAEHDNLLLFDYCPQNINNLGFPLEANHSVVYLDVFNVECIMNEI